MSMGSSVDLASLFDGTGVPAAVLRFFHVPPGKVSEIAGIEDAACCLGIRKVTPFVAVEDVVKELSSSRERGGYILAAGDTCDEASENARTAGSLIKIEVC